MHAPISRHALAGACAIAVPAGSDAVPRAQAAAAPGWRIVRVLRHCGADSMSSITAAGPRDARAAGKPSSGGPACGADAEHWNGMRWQRVPVPSRVSLGFPAGPVTATSATGAWIFPARLAHVKGSYFAYNYALHRNGETWQKPAFPARLIIGSAVAFGPADVRASGSACHREGVLVPYAARYDGRAWRKATLPGAPLAVSALSRRDMRAIGPTLATAAKPPARQALIAMHWNGRPWHALPVPPAKVPGRHSQFLAAQLAAAGKHQIWRAYQISGQQNSASSPGLARSHGRHRRAISMPAAISGTGAMTQDGHGGIWLLADVEVNYDSRQY